MEDLWTWLDRLSDLLQILNYEMLIKDASNNDLMQKLQNQDIVLEEQTEKYLKSIDNKLDTIIDILERSKDA